MIYPDVDKPINSLPGRTAKTPGANTLGKPITPVPSISHRYLPVAGIALALCMGLAGCDKRAESNPGSTPAAIGSQSTSGSTADQPSSSVETRTPAAPDGRQGGSSGSQGMPAVPDTSGAPTSTDLNNNQPRIATPGTGGAAPGSTTGAGAPSPGSSNGSAITAGNANRAADGSVQGNPQGAGTSPRPSDGTTNGGLPASALGGTGTSNGNTNSHPSSNTGNR